MVPTTFSLGAAMVLVGVTVPLSPRPTAFAQALQWAQTLGVAPAMTLPTIGPVALALPVSRSAADGPNYAGLRDLFETAREPVGGPSEFLRWRAGRIFKPERPNEPLNSLLAGAEVPLPDGSVGLRLFPVQTFRPVDEIPNRPELAQWVRDLIRDTPVDGPGPEFGERAVRFGLCRGGICHRYEVRRNNGLVLLRYQATPEAGGAPIATWYGYYRSTEFTH